jgi:glycosyltransferase involved in cell wall biosynthesis
MTGLTISVAMCTFNGAPFLGAQLASIAAQQRPPDELVVCDDGSSDGCRDIVREFAQRTKFRTRLIVNDKNLGSTKNFEKAVTQCQCAIVALADQDDVWYEHKLGRIEEAFLRSNSTVAAFSDADLIDNASQPLDVRLWDTFSFNLAEQRWFANGRALNILVRRPVVTGATMAFRRELFDFLAPIPADQVHDSWMSFLLAVRGQFEVIPEPLMQYRQHRRQQIGPGALTLRERVARARETRTSAYLEQIKQFRQLYGRLEELGGDFPYAGYARSEIKKKISHLEHRAQLPHWRIARIPSVLWEAINRSYWCYSDGWKSVAKDLLIR